MSIQNPDHFEEELLMWQKLLESVNLRLDLLYKQVKEARAVHPSEVMIQDATARDRIMYDINSLHKLRDLLRLVHDFKFSIHGELYNGERTSTMERTSSDILDHFLKLCTTGRLCFWSFLKERNDLAVGVLKIFEYWLPLGLPYRSVLGTLVILIGETCGVRGVSSVDRYHIEVDLENDPEQIKFWFGCDPRTEDDEGGEDEKDSEDEDEEEEEEEERDVDERSGRRLWGTHRVVRNTVETKGPKLE